MIEVRDRKNPERLLGHFVRRPLARLNGPCISIAVMPRMQAPPVYAAPDPWAPVEVTRVRLNVIFRTSPCGWEKTAELHTDTPLGVLMMLEGFHLPGETAAQARRRHLYA